MMGRGMRGMHRQPLSEEEKNANPGLDKKLLKRIGAYLKPFYKQMILVCIIILISSALSLLPSLLTGRIIDEGLIGGNLKTLLILIGISVGVLVLSNLISVLESYLNTWVSQQITYRMRNEMYAHLQQMSYRFYSSSMQGDIITRMTSDIDGVRSVISGTLSSIISNVSVLILALIAMYQKNWLLATVGVIIVPLFILPTRRVGKRRWAITLAA
jgi:ATP-binding cassette subfamily B protein